MEEKKSLFNKNTIMTVLAFTILLGGMYFNYTDNSDNEIDTNEVIIESDIIGYKWKASDESVLYLYEDNTFKWYKNDDDHSDNYYSGTYTLYNGTRAIMYVADDLEKYGVTYSEQYRLIESNDSSLDNYYNLNLYNEECIINGVNELSETLFVPRLGFYLEDSKVLDLVNMNSANYNTFTRKEKIEE